MRRIAYPAVPVGDVLLDGNKRPAEPIDEIVAVDVTAIVEPEKRIRSMILNERTGERDDRDQKHAHERSDEERGTSRASRFRQCRIQDILTLTAEGGSRFRRFSR